MAKDEATRLAEQARHDVEQLRLLQAQGDQPTGPGDQSSPHPPAVQWILPSPGPAPRASPVRIAPPPDAETPQPRDPRPAQHGQHDPAADAEPPGPRSPQDDRIRQLIVELSAELYRQASYGDMPLPELLLIGATMMVSPDRALVPEAIPGLTDRERELIGKMQTFFAQLGRDLVNSGDPEAIVTAVNALHSTLATEPQLRLANAALCTEVRGFGSYDEFGRNSAGRYAFLAHSDQQVVVYVEIEDFASELNDKGLWLTKLSQQLVVYSDRDGIPVWREDWQAGVDASKNRREDFWMVQVITLPRELSVGRYQLKIHIRDEHSGAETETAIDFEMVADPRMAGTGAMRP